MVRIPVPCITRNIMKKTSALLFLLCVSTAPLCAQEEIRFAELQLEGGEVLHDVRLISAEPDALRLEHRDGACRVKFDRLPENIQKQFKYDPVAAQAFAEEQRKKREERAAAEADARLSRLIADAAENQTRDVTASRISFYQTLESDAYDFITLESALQESIALLKEAGRADLAELLTSDLKVLRERQAHRAGDAQRKAQEALQARIRKLEQELQDQQRQQEADAQAARNARFIDPYYNSVYYPYYVNRPVYHVNGGTPCPPVRPAVSPWIQAYRPPVQLQQSSPYQRPYGNGIPTRTVQTYQQTVPQTRPAFTPAAQPAFQQVVPQVRKALPAKPEGQRMMPSPPVRTRTK